MTDDDLLRDALRAEADGVEADPELLRRIRSATGEAPTAHRRPWLLAAAAVAVVVGLTAIALATRDDDHQSVDVVDTPDTTAMPAPSTTAPAETTTTDSSGPTTAPRPALVALVRDDGWLVTVDLASGEQRELAFTGDPAASSDVEEGGPYYIDSVDLSPDGRWLYYSTCCEPAVGVTYRIPVGGGEREQVGFGASPRVSPDGRYVAMSASAGLTVVDVEDLGAEPVHRELDLIPFDLAWSPDGRQLAFTVNAGRSEGDAEILLMDFDGTALTPADAGKPTTHGRFATWLPDGMLNVVAGDAVINTRSISQDPSYQWILWVDGDGVVREQAGAQSSDRTPISGLPTALSADW
jgi:dipeptidyl aminopeptidase/acylaminoacyl peptidase